MNNGWIPASAGMTNQMKGMKHKPVIRGGSWNNNDNNCRVANRNNNNPDNSNNNIGFRLVNAINSYTGNETFTLSLLQPELAGGISAGRATQIAQFHALVPKHRMINHRLVGREPRKPLFLNMDHWLQPVVALASAGRSTDFSRCVTETQLHA